MPFTLGGPELFIILAIVLIVFGAGKLPNAFKDFGRGVKEFKKAQVEDEAGTVTPMVAPGMASMAANSAAQWARPGAESPDGAAPAAPPAAPPAALLASASPRP